MTFSRTMQKIGALPAVSLALGLACAAPLSSTPALALQKAAVVAHAAPTDNVSFMVYLLHTVNSSAGTASRSRYAQVNESNVQSNRVHNIQSKESIQQTSNISNDRTDYSAKRIIRGSLSFLLTKENQCNRTQLINHQQNKDQNQVLAR